jgi:hypothetical protein
VKKLSILRNVQERRRSRGTPRIFGGKDSRKLNIRIGAGKLFKKGRLLEEGSF